MLTRVVSPRIRVAAIAALVIVGGIAWMSIRYEATISRLVAFLSSAQDEALGPDWSAVRLQRSLAATVPDLERELAAAKRAGTKPVAGVRVTGSGEFENRCPGQTLPSAPVEGGAIPVASPLHVEGEVQGAITGLADGSIQQTWRMWTTLRWPDGHADKHELESTEADIWIDPAVKDAWAEAVKVQPRRWREFRFGATVGKDGVGVPLSYSEGGKLFGWWVGGDLVLSKPDNSRIGAGGALRF